MAQPYRPGDPVPRGMEVRAAASAWPFYGAAAVWLVCALFAPMYSWLHLLVILLVSVGAFLLLWKLCPKRQVLVPVPEKAPDTGVPEADEVLAQGRRGLRELQTLNDQIHDPALSRQMDRLSQVGGAIFDYVEAHPGEAPQLRKFLNYYLPTTLKLLKSYRQMSGAQVEGENITSAKKGVEGIMAQVVKAFEKQYDNLFSNEALDLSAEISVLESMLSQEGLDGPDFKLK